MKKVIFATEPGTCFYYWALKSLETFLLSSWASSCFGIVVASDYHGIPSATKKTHVFTQGSVLLCPSTSCLHSLCEE